MSDEFVFTEQNDEFDWKEIAKGDPGDDGITPVVEVTEISGGHNVAFDYGEGDERNVDFDVMDGEVSMEALDAALANKAPVITDTASGAIASFPDGADGLPVKDLTVGIEPVQSGTGDPSPTNVRPISGWTGCNVSRTGKNLLKNNQLTSKTKNGVEITLNSDGSTTFNGTCTGWFFQQIYQRSNDEILLPPGNYIISGGIPNVYITIYLADSSKVVNYTQILSDVPFTIPDGNPVSQVRFEISANFTFSNATMHLMIRPASVSNSDYEPYSGTTIPISWQSEAGTVYGGTLDVTSGVLTVTMASVDLGSLSWTKNNEGTEHERWSTVVSNAAKFVNHSTAVNLLCSIFQSATYPQIYNHQKDEAIGFYDSTTILVWSSVYSSFTKQEFEAAMSGVKLVYELATPQTYQLTPEEVTTLLGQNNIWADCGPSTVEYPADTKLYIQKINSPTDDDMVADANIASGKYFIVNNNLYLSTTTILAGDPIKPGTNCTLTNLAAALNAINS